MVSAGTPPAPTDRVADLKSWLIWLILAASAAGFAALVVTDGDAHAKRPAHHPKQTSGHTLTPDAAWGGQIAYAVPRRGADPTVVEVATSLQRKAVAVYRAPDGQVVRGLTWSPDGAQLAVVVGTYGGDGHVLVMDVTGEHLIAVTHGAVSTASVAWSPDGRLLAYDLAQTAQPNRGAPLVVSRTDGSGRRKPRRDTGSRSRRPGLRTVAALRTSHRGRSPTRRRREAR